MAGLGGTTSCYKLTKTGAARAYAYICDNANINDMHTLSPGIAYVFSAYIYTPSTGGPASNEVVLDIDNYYSGTWHQSQDSASTQDSWELLTKAMTMHTTAGGFKASIEISSDADVGEFIYVDDIRFHEAGITNYHAGNFLDQGTRTYLH